ncbi:MAG TPA: hypothetical protein VLL08_17150 [Kineosporiaceae bacterium]|nr:hypothetical protein [Kineosporiaceae bacterium]
MSQDLGQLLLKALNGLSTEEQGELLAQLVSRSAPMPWAGASVGMDVPIDGNDPAAVASLLGVAQVLRAPRRSGQTAVSEPELKVLPVRLPVADYERLREWSKSHDFSMAVIIRTLVERFLDAQEAKSPPRPVD